MNRDSRASSPVSQHESSSGDSDSGENVEQMCWRVDDRCQALLEPLRTWEHKVVEVLDMIRRREFTEPNPKMYNISEPTRFCEFNIALFDLDKESEVVHGPLFREIPPSDYCWLDDSTNIISISVAESDVPYPFNIYGTVLARDMNDYRCVYLFKRGRDDPQLITRQNCMLALTGPYRALGSRDNMYFEFHLKIKGMGAVDQDFSKGMLVRNACTDTPRRPRTFSLDSWLSTVEMVCVPVFYALEASVGINFLNGESSFTGKISAATSGNDMNEMVLYDSEVASTETKLGSGGSVSLTRHIVAVPLDEDLLLYISVRKGNNKSERLKFVVRHDEERTHRLGTYELQVNTIWKGVFRQQRPNRKVVGDAHVLW